MTVLARMAMAGLLAAGAQGCRTGSDAHAPEERQAAQVATNLPGWPPASGLRYWGRFRELPAGGCYVSVHTREQDGQRTFELWQNAWGDGGATNRGIIVHRGPALDRLGTPEVACDGTVIDDVPDPKQPGRLSPLRGFTRPALTWDAREGYILLTCVCPDYQPGSVPLLPALLVSKTGAPGTFRYLGRLKGDVEVEASLRTVWSDGGSLVRLDDGRWRIYLNGFGATLSALEGGALAGPWTFVREPAGAYRELLPDFPRKPNYAGCFPTVLRVAADNWHLWISDTWPPQAIWHFWSQDGLTWAPYGLQPEITRAAVGGQGIKCLRAYLDADGRQIVGLLSVWKRQPDGEKGWVLHESRMPAGPPPGISRRD